LRQRSGFRCGGRADFGKLGREPTPEARYWRQRREAPELRKFGPQFLDHLLDQEIAE
jgi:hypothetical protein